MKTRTTAFLVSFILVAVAAEHSQAQAQTVTFTGVNYSPIKATLNGGTTAITAKIATTGVADGTTITINCDIENTTTGAIEPNTIMVTINNNAATFTGKVVNTPAGIKGDSGTVGMTVSPPPSLSGSYSSAFTFK